jgi:hypothetical protein
MENLSSMAMNMCTWLLCDGLRDNACAPPVADGRPQLPKANEQSAKTQKNTVTKLDEQNFRFIEVR